MNSEVTGEKFYQKSWFAIIMLILLAPIGIYLIWRYEHFKKTPRIFLSVVSSILFLIVVFTNPEDENHAEGGSEESKEVTSEAVDGGEDEKEEKNGKPDNADAENMEGEEENEGTDDKNENEDENVIEKEKLYFDLVSSSYDEDKNQIDMEAETNFANGIKVSIGLVDKTDGYSYGNIYTSGVIEDGKLVVNLEGTDENSEDPLASFIMDGEYDIIASMSSQDNKQFLKSYDDYDSFMEQYDLSDGTVEETDSGFTVEEIYLGDIEIAGAHTMDEFDRLAFEEEKDMYEEIDYAQLNKNPDGHTGEFVRYTGEIIQIMEEEDFTIIRLAVTEDEWGYDVNDIVWVEYDEETEFVDDDIVTVYGMIYGAHSYTSQAGWEISLPAILADHIE